MFWVWIQMVCVASCMLFWLLNGDVDSSKYASVLEGVPRKNGRLVSEEQNLAYEPALSVRSSWLKSWDCRTEMLGIQGRRCQPLEMQMLVKDFVEVKRIFVEVLSCKRVIFTTSNFRIRIHHIQISATSNVLHQPQPTCTFKTSTFDGILTYSITSLKELSRLWAFEKINSALYFCFCFTQTIQQRVGLRLRPFRFSVLKSTSNNKNSAIWPFTPTSSIMKPTKPTEKLKAGSEYLLYDLAIRNRSTT